MFFPLLFWNPPAYFAMRQAAVVRHAMAGMPPALHFAWMRAVYGF